MLAGRSRAEAPRRRLSPASFADTLSQETLRWAAIVKPANLRVE